MRCKNCKEAFEVKYFNQKFCMEKDECISAFVTTVRKKKEQEDQKKRISEKKQWTKEKTVIKENLKKQSDWLHDLEKEVNKICRLIDFDQPCISCNGNGKPQAGHYHSVASDATIRFNLHNTHIQDYICNVQKSANIIGYDEGLIKTYGSEYWNYVKFGIKNQYHQPLKLAVYEIKEKIVICKSIIKQLESENLKRSPEERIILRDIFNRQIGIYLKNYLK